MSPYRKQRPRSLYDPLTCNDGRITRIWSLPVVGGAVVLAENRADMACLRRLLAWGVNGFRAGRCWVATRVLADEDLEALRGFPEIGREELARFFTLTPADVAFIDPGPGLLT